MRRNLSGTHSCLGSEKQSSFRFPRPARSPRRRLNRHRGAAPRLGFHEFGDVTHLVANCRAIDALEWAADIQPTFVLQHFHTAGADRSVRALVDPRPRNWWYLRKID